MLVLLVMMGLILSGCFLQGRKIWLCLCVIFVKMSVLEDGGDFEEKGWRKLVPIALQKKQQQQQQKLVVEFAFRLILLGVIWSDFWKSLSFLGGLFGLGWNQVGLLVGFHY